MDHDHTIAIMALGNSVRRTSSGPYTVIAVVTTLSHNKDGWRRGPPPLSRVEPGSVGVQTE